MPIQSPFVTVHRHTAVVSERSRLVFADVLGRLSRVLVPVLLAVHLQVGLVLESVANSSNALGNDTVQVRLQPAVPSGSCVRASGIQSVHDRGGFHLSEHVSLDYQR